MWCAGSATRIIGHIFLFFTRCFCVRTIDRGLRPPRSPDLNPCDMLKCKGHTSNPRTEGHREQHSGCSSAFRFASIGQATCLSDVASVFQPMGNTNSAFRKCGE